MRLIGATVRRFVASLMLLAALAFAFHGATHAGDLHLSGDICHAAAGSAPDGHHHKHAHHDHGTHDHADQAQADHHHDQDVQKAPCCGSICTVAISAMPGLGLAAMMHRLTGFVPPDTFATGIQPDGLHRPPKPLTPA